MGRIGGTSRTSLALAAAVALAAVVALGGCSTGSGGADDPQPDSTGAAASTTAGVEESPSTSLPNETAATTSTDVTAVAAWVSSMCMAVTPAFEDVMDLAAAGDAGLGSDVEDLGAIIDRFTTIATSFRDAAADVRDLGSAPGEDGRETAHAFVQHLSTLGSLFSRIADRLSNAASYEDDELEQQFNLLLLQLNDEGSHVDELLRSSSLGDAIAADPGCAVLLSASGS